MAEAKDQSVQKPIEDGKYVTKPSFKNRQEFRNSVSGLARPVS